MKYELTEDQIKELGVRYTYRAPRDDQKERYEEIRSTFLAVAMGLQQNCPASRELSLALTHLEQANLYANAAIARREP